MVRLVTTCWIETWGYFHMISSLSLSSLYCLLLPLLSLWRFVCDSRNLVIHTLLSLVGKHILFRFQNRRICMKMSREREERRETSMSEKGSLSWMKPTVPVMTGQLCKQKARENERETPFTTFYDTCGTHFNACSWMKKELTLCSAKSHPTHVPLKHFFTTLLRSFSNHWPDDFIWKWEYAPQSLYLLLLQFSLLIYAN